MLILAIYPIIDKCPFKECNKCISTYQRSLKIFISGIFRVAI